MPKFPFHFLYHSIPFPGCRFYTTIIIVTFNPNGCSQFENPEAPDFEKIASASSSFSTLSLPSLLPLSTYFIKVLPLPQKFIRFHRFRFQLPLPLTHSWFTLLARNYMGEWVQVFMQNTRTTPQKNIFKPWNTQQCVLSRSPSYFRSSKEPAFGKNAQSTYRCAGR